MVSSTSHPDSHRPDTATTTMTTTTTTAAATTAAMKSRIITHMNADHADSLSLFLQHYCGVPPSMADKRSGSASTSTSVRLEDITLSHLIVASPIGRNLIPIDPPMKTLAEARERLVAMHRESLAGLGFSDIVVSEYRWPQGWWQILVFITCAVAYLSLSRRQHFAPGSSPAFMYQIWSVGGLWPG